jgi:hypothetical protein
LATPSTPSFDGAIAFDRTIDPALVIDTPVLHVMGRTDIIVIREKSDVLIAHSKNKRVEEHVGGMCYLFQSLKNQPYNFPGHFIPTRPKWRKFFVEFFRNPFGEIASPSAMSDEVSSMRMYRIGETLPERTYELESADDTSTKRASYTDARGKVDSTSTKRVSYTDAEKVDSPCDVLSEGQPSPPPLLARIVTAFSTFCYSCPCGGRGKAKRPLQEKESLPV